MQAERFYLRAVEYYRNCLALFPKSFDAAYNKARLEFHIFQTFHENLPRLERISALEGILRDHDFALTLRLSDDRVSSQGKVKEVTESQSQPVLEWDGKNDLLYNTAQVMLSLAEEKCERAAFANAAEWFERTWEVQVRELQKSASSISGQDLNLDDDRGRSEDRENYKDGENYVEDNEEYATVIEPVTYTSLLETATAQLTCLIPVYVLSGLASGAAYEDPQMRSVGELVLGRILELLANQDGYYIKEDDIAETATVVARYLSVSGFPEFKQINVDRLFEIWKGKTSDTDAMSGNTLEELLSRLSTSSVERYLAQANLFTTFSFSVSPEEGWRALSGAVQALSEALRALSSNKGSNLVLGKDTKAEQIKLWTARGDTDLLRSNLNCENAVKNQIILRKNAEIYYKNALKLSSTTGTVEAQLIKEIQIKLHLVLGEWELLQTIEGWQEVLRDAVDDGLYSSEMVLQHIG